MSSEERSINSEERNLDSVHHCSRRKVSTDLETRADHAGIETGVKKLVEDLKSTLVDTQRDATAKLRLLSKHNMDNRIVMANLATIPEGRKAIGQEDGIPVLVEVVELGSARGKEYAAAALLQLCTNSSRLCHMVLQEGAVPPQVALSQSGTQRAKEKAQTLLSYFRNQRHGDAGRA